MQIIAETGGLAARRLLRCGRLPCAPPGAGSPAARFNVPIRTVIVDTQTGARPSTAWAAGSPGTPAPRASTTRRSRRPASSPRGARASSCSRRCATSPARGSGISTATSPVCAAPPRTSGSTFDEAAVMEAMEREAARFPDMPRAHPRRDRPTRSGGDGRRRRCPTYPDVGPGGRRHGRSGRPRRPDAVPQDVAAAALRGGAGPPPRRRRRAARRTCVGEVTESTIANVAVRPDGRWCTPPLGRRVAAGRGPRGGAGATGWRRARRRSRSTICATRRGGRARERRPGLAAGAAAPRAADARASPPRASPPGRAGTRTVASPTARPAGRRTAGSEGAPRTRARCARSTGSSPLASREARSCRSSSVAALGGSGPPPSSATPCSTLNTSGLGALGPNAPGRSATPATRLPSCSCACRAARTRGRARAASSSSTCCSGTASSRTPARRRRDPVRTACSAVGAAGRSRLGTVRLPRSSHPSARTRLGQ